MAFQNGRHPPNSAIFIYDNDIRDNAVKSITDGPIKGYPEITEEMLGPEIPLEIQMEMGYTDRCRDEYEIIFRYGDQSNLRNQPIARIRVGDIKEMYYGSRLPIKELRKKIGVDIGMLRKQMDRHGIRLLKGAYVGKNYEYRMQRIGKIRTPSSSKYPVISVETKQNKVKTTTLHRKTVEDHLGRSLLPSENIHHIDFDKKNNELYNLKVCSPSKHAKFHQSMFKIGKYLYYLGLIKFDNDGYYIDYSQLTDRCAYEMKACG